MTLQDFIRDNTRSIEEQQRVLEKQIEDLIGQRTATEERIHQLATDIGKQSEKVHQHKGKLHTTTETERDLRQSISKLENQLTKISREQSEIKTGLKQYESKISKCRRQQAGEGDIVEEINTRLRGLEIDKNNLQAKSVERSRQALSQYLSYLNKQIENLLLTHQERAEKTLTLDKLKSARHENRDIADLCEAREEWQKIMKSANVPKVKIAAQDELDKIEATLDARFPGALEVESAPFATEMIEELFFVEHEPRNEVALILPIDPSAWEEIACGKCGPQQTMALQIAWAFVRTTDATSKNSRFDYVKNSFIALTGSHLHEILEKGDNSIQLPAAGTARFILSSLPHEMEEVFFNEETPA